MSDDERAPSSPDPLRRLRAPQSTYALTRFVLLRLLGLVYLFAFLAAARQNGPLLGPNGLLPATDYLARVTAGAGSRADAFESIPTLFFWVTPTDGALRAVAWIGVVLALAVCAGATNAILQILLWALYMSIVHVGQIFYGYGWEIQLLETGFLAVFLCPTKSISPFPTSGPPITVIVLFRWLACRIMLGAGLIKLRGDPCWRDLTCLVYHYETQPIPHPLSYLIHRLPRWIHAIGVLFNHLVELVVPFFVFGPRPARLAAGILMIAFQGTLILSGNLSFLNWLTIVPAIACLDDRALGRLFPARIRALAEGRVEPPARAARIASYVLAVVVGFLSIDPVANLFESRQAMNRSFDPLALVNTYGAFGSVGKERYEVVLEGTSDAAANAETQWREYELPCKPGDVHRRPCVTSPYHRRLDWQMWFAGFGSPRNQPWIVHLTYKLLKGERGVMGLFANDPFPDRPPRLVRASLYRYEFTRPGDGSGAWWRRTYVREYLKPLSLGDPALVAFMDAHGWRHE
jgi:hypothetical protein